MTEEPGHIHVWFRLTASMSQPEIAAARRLLSPDERARCDRYRLVSDRRDYAAAHALLRVSLSRCCTNVDPNAWIFDVDAHGKPELMSPRPSAGPLTFNLSHSRGIVACAIAPGTAVGIDVVLIDDEFDYSSIARQCLSSDELVQLEALAPDSRSSRFMELWALKEAYTKATGRGLSERLSDLGFAIDSGRICFLSPRNVASATWRFGLFTPAPQYRLAVAIDCRHTPVSRLHLSSANGTSEAELASPHLLTVT